MLHDAKTYADPFEFNPDRFIKEGKLNADVKDPSHIAFGFGRRYSTSFPFKTLVISLFLRICPGRHMAFSAIWIAIASMVATFDITKALDDHGNTIEPSHDYISTVVRSATNL